MKAAIFDMDGLLFDSERLLGRTLSEAMSEHGYVFNKDVYISMLGSNSFVCARIMKAYYGEDYDYDKISDEAREKMNILVNEEGMPVKPGIPELLQMLKRHNIPCAVASSTESVHVREYLKISGLDKFFAVVVGGENVSRSKPEPDIFLFAAEKLGATPEDTMVFEDSENGIKAAVNGNFPVVCIEDMKHHNKKIQSLCAAYTHDAFEALEFAEKNIR